MARRRCRSDGHRSGNFRIRYRGVGQDSVAQDGRHVRDFFQFDGGPSGGCDFRDQFRRGFAIAAARAEDEERSAAEAPATEPADDDAAEDAEEGN